MGAARVRFPELRGREFEEGDARTVARVHKFGGRRSRGRRLAGSCIYQFFGKLNLPLQKAHARAIDANDRVNHSGDARLLRRVLEVLHASRGHQTAQARERFPFAVTPLVPFATGACDPARRGSC